MGPRVVRIFISYAREDAEIARRIYRDLKALGAEPWLDTECLLPGQKWSQEVGKAIRSSDFFLALLSNTALGKRGYVQKELREALSVLDEIPEGSIYLLPVRLDDCRPENPKMEELHWVDLFPSYQTGFEKIVRVVRPPNMPREGLPVPSKVEDEADLSRQGWGIIFPAHSDTAVRDALRPLLQLRRDQAARRDERFYREFSQDTAYRPGDSYLQFLAQNGVGPGVPDPSRVPSYLLIVGGPEIVPFEFQYDLGIQYRVGRLHFDSTDEYRNYAESVASVEAGEYRPSRRAAFFSTRHEGDVSTQLAETQLTTPLFESISQAIPDWNLRNVAGAQSTKLAFLSLLKGKDRPDFIFVACHGLSFPLEHELQATDQGSLVCADWPGVQAKVDREHYVSASDIDPLVDLRGLQLISFAEFGAGTPRKDDFGYAPWGYQPFSLDLAAQPFVSHLAKRLLGRRCGASALLAHVNRTWTSSFTWKGAGPQIQTFVNAVGAVLSGKPIGLAHKYFSTRYAELTANLSSKLAASVSPSTEMTLLWIATVDARNYVVIGDPAARIAP